MNTEHFCKKKISALLADYGIFGVTVFAYKSLTSTNDKAKEYLSQNGGDSPLLFVADEQTAGRGRMGRSFFSPSSGLYLSLALPLAGGLTSSVLSLTSAAAVSAVLGVRETCAVPLGIKWVNDLYTPDGKAGGILCETFSSGGKLFAVIGLGINLADPDFPDELGGKAAGLGVNPRIKNALAAVFFRRMLEFLRLAEQGQEEEYMSIYREHSITLGREIIYTAEGKEHHARALSVDNFGRLTVKHSDGSHAILSTGEISLRIKDNFL